MHTVVEYDMPGGCLVLVRGDIRIVQESVAELRIVRLARIQEPVGRDVYVTY